MVCNNFLFVVRKIILFVRKNLHIFVLEEEKGTGELFLTHSVPLVVIPSFRKLILKRNDDWGDYRVDLEAYAFLLLPCVYGIWPMETQRDKGQ